MRTDWITRASGLVVPRPPMLFPGYPCCCAPGVPPADCEDADQVSFSITGSTDGKLDTTGRVAFNTPYAACPDLETCYVGVLECNVSGLGWASLTLSLYHRDPDAADDVTYPWADACVTDPIATYIKSHIHHDDLAGNHELTGSDGTASVWTAAATVTEASHHQYTFECGSCVPGTIEFEVDSMVFPAWECTWTGAATHTTSFSGCTFTGGTLCRVYVPAWWQYGSNTWRGMFECGTYTTDGTPSQGYVYVSATRYCWGWRVSVSNGGSHTVDTSVESDILDYGFAEMYTTTYMGVEVSLFLDSGIVFTMATCMETATNGLLAHRQVTCDDLEGGGSEINYGSWEALEFSISPGDMEECGYPEDDTCLNYVNPGDNPYPADPITDPPTTGDCGLCDEDTDPLAWDITFDGTATTTADGASIDGGPYRVCLVDVTDTDEFCIWKGYVSCKTFDTPGRCFALTLTDLGPDGQGAYMVEVHDNHGNLLATYHAEGSGSPIDCDDPPGAMIPIDESSVTCTIERVDPADCDCTPDDYIWPHDIGVNRDGQTGYYLSRDEDGTICGGCEPDTLDLTVADLAAVTGDCLGPTAANLDGAYTLEKLIVPALPIDDEFALGCQYDWLSQATNEYMIGGKSAVYIYHEEGEDWAWLVFFDNLSGGLTMGVSFISKLTSGEWQTVWLVKKSLGTSSCMGIDEEFIEGDGDIVDWRLTDYCHDIDDDTTITVQSSTDCWCEDA